MTLAAPSAPKPIEDTAAARSDLLLYAPTRYIDCTPYREPMGAPGERVVRAIKLLTRKAFDRRGNSVAMPSSGRRAPYRLRLQVKDRHGKEYRLSVLGDTQPWLDAPLDTWVLTQVDVTEWEGVLSLRAVRIIPVEFAGRAMPVYRAQPDLGDAASITRAVHDAINSAMPYAVARVLQVTALDEVELLRRAGLEHWRDVEHYLRDLHAPDTAATGERALCALGRLTAFALLQASQLKTPRRPDPDAILTLHDADLAACRARLPFALTADQEQAVADIVADLRSHRPMRRILSGDVGTGKTLVFLLAAIAARAAGARVGILIPNILVTQQVAAEAKLLAPDLPLLVLTGDFKGKPDLSACPLIIGTTAMISRISKTWGTLDLLVVDEQQKLATRQRDALVGPATNVLEATATAIPRSMAHVVVGNWDLSVLAMCPYNKQITTRLLQSGEDSNRRLAAFAVRCIKAGHQVAIVYPRRQAAEEDRMSVEEAAGVWEKLAPGWVGALHGQMPDEEKGRVIQSMKDGQIRCLVCSTVIEVGITIPSLRLVIVVEPERMGLAQLHQLRGRVARHGGAGAFYMLATKSLSDDEAGRLSIMEQCGSGFELQERDMAIRGCGDLLHGVTQSGVTTFLFRGVKVTPDDLLAASTLAAPNVPR